MDETTSKTAANTEPAAEEIASPLLTAPVVLKKKKKKRRKTKYSSGTEFFQRFAYGLSRSGFRVANSFSIGLDTFSKRSNRSRRKKRDGMARDMFRNASRGFSDGMTELGKAPEELTKQVGTKRVWKMVRVLLQT